jgi:outer membrane protein assembly factor BamB
VALVLGSIGGVAPVTAKAPASTAQAAPTSIRNAAAGIANWTSYHYDNTGAGYDPNQPSFTTLQPGWTQTAITGDIYAEPLVYGGTVYIATQANYLYALDAGTGAIQWSMQLSTPMSSSVLPCGNISPNVGITSTPVIDTSLNRIYMVGMVSTEHYVLWGVNLTTHAIDVNAVVDPGVNTVVLHEGQRGALRISQGVVYIPFGGRWGDCQPYHGQVLGARATDGAVLYSFSTRGFGSGIWATGGMSIDASGNVYVATGNGDPPDSESVFVLSPTLSVLYHWIPANQAALDTGDIDVGSISPGLVGGGDVIQGGKSGDSVLLDSTMGERQNTHVCNGENFGATGYFSPYIYMPCNAGLFALQQSGHTFTTKWSRSFQSGPPIIAGGAVMALDVSNGTLHAMDPVSGTDITTASAGTVGHFATPATGYGMVFVGATSQVVAFTLTGTRCTSASMSPGVASPQAPGATVTFTASSTTCTTPEYKFFLQPPGGSWTAQTGFGANTWAWNTTGLANGVYGVGVWARLTGSGSSYEAYWLGTYTLSVLTCTAATMSTATAPPQPPGTSITFTAAATRCPGAQFRFWMLPPGGSWTMQRDYGVNSWTWDTTGLAAGTYQLGAWARQPGSTSSYDAFGFTTFRLGTGTCNSAGLTPSLATPQAPGATVVFTGTSNSCTSPLYQFWLLPPGGSWTVKQAYSATTTWSWNTSGMPLGTYQVGVWAKASASSASYDAYFIGTYQLDIGFCTSASISAAPASPQAPGTAVTFTASSTGCTSPTYEFWILPPSATTWAVARTYTSGTTFAWSTTGLAPGPYRVGVWARQTGSSNSYDSYAILTFWLGS